MKLDITKLFKITKSFYDKHDDLIKDIILFGSFVKGKSSPNDVDIMIIFLKKINKDVEYDFKKQISFLYDNFSIISKVEKDVYDFSFDARESVLFEGLSLVDKVSFASKFGFDSLGIFIYKTKQLTNVKKTRFYYALNGRNSKGMIDELDAIRLSDNIIAVPLVNIEPTKEFFLYWDIEYSFIPSLIPSRLAKKTILKKII